MKVAFGLKAHSGWAALVVVGKQQGDFVLVERRRIELVKEAWAKQPYHAAENLPPAAAHNLVKRGVKAAQQIALREMRAAISRERKRDNEAVALAVLAGNPLPAWSVAEILAVHFRMHKAEGALFRDVLARAGEACGLRLLPISEKLLLSEAQQTLQISANELRELIVRMGKAGGAPWGRDQKDAAVGALSALSLTA